MCRIFGVSFGEEPEDVPLSEIATFAYKNLIHGGPHSYGYMYPTPHGALRLYKRPGRADGPQVGATLSALLPEHPAWFCGHLRYATNGSPDQNVNNHPITHQNIVGVHNGIVRNYEDILSITGRHDETAEVDSEAIFAAVNKWGHAPGLRKIMGDMVTVYTDLRKPHLLHIARSSGRRLALGWTKKGNIFFASEKQTLLMLERSGIKFTDFSAVRENRHLVLKSGNIIYRHTFRAEPQQSFYEKSDPITSSLDNPLFFIEHYQQQRKKALRAANIRFMFDPRDEGAMLVTDDVFYYKGLLVTPEEFVEIKAGEENPLDDF